MALTFKGGIHPEDCKSYTKDIPIHVHEGDDEHVFLLQQHLGAPTEPIVEIGQKVLVGEKIADSQAFVSAPIHSSVSGVVKAIEKRLAPNGTYVNAIIIENDRLYEEDSAIALRDDLDKLSPKEIINIVREAGIVGMGGAGFPTHVKLTVAPEKKIDYVIVNGAECEPYLTSDHRILLEKAYNVLDGLKAVMKIFGLDKGYIGIENNKPDAIISVKNLLEKYPGIEVRELVTKYPQGSEKQLIYSITKREVPSGGLPADVGCIVINVDTARAIGRAIRRRMPLIKRIVTVSGDCIKSPANFSVRIGASLRSLIDAAGGFICEPAKIIHGGPMMGVAQSSIDVPVIKTSSGILAFSKNMVVYNEQAKCIRCGKCVSACPMHLMPLYLNMYAKKGDWDMCDKYNAADCIECGVCSYLCPGRQHPVQNIRIARQKILEKRRAGK